MMINMLNFIITCLCILLSVAYFTLFERKVLGYCQIRLGPNKVSINGILQPISDALKLFLKENMSPIKSNYLVFYLVSVFGLFLMLYLWSLYPSETSFFIMNYSVMLFICLSGMSVYFVMVAGWSSNSKYSFLGAMRAAAQSISYEVSMIFLLLFPIMLNSTLNMNNSIYQFPSILFFFILSWIWFISTLAETNRAPFDFAEGESELVSGFNIEYQGGLFALLFLSEYASIIFMSLMTVVWFFNISKSSIMVIFIMIMVFMYILIRAIYPRYRYDLLMMLCWKCFLPFSLSSLMFMPLFFI
uniref:NADH-ubiquinone oxidoreductase chain 1 n=1 Tax=Succinea erythrophana TaxID=3003847 RepID=A0A9E9ESZ8_9EUPU|nr:NADH dehydrogenase subunit 1 [Succinea erythrophana]WAO26021.1 NADH dehydrogenase subunit 1 [Succinea erythrophana]